MEKLIFGFYTDGDGARLEINGDIADVLSGFVLAFTVNPDVKETIKKALTLSDDMGDEITNMIKENVRHETKNTEATTD